MKFQVGDRVALNGVAQYMIGIKGRVAQVDGFHVAVQLDACVSDSVYWCYEWNLCLVETDVAWKQVGF